MIPCPRGMLDSAGDFFYKRRLTNRRGVFQAAPRFSRPGDAQVAQLVEQRTENPRVGGSIPPLDTNYIKGLAIGWPLFLAWTMRQIATRNINELQRGASNSG